MKIIISIFLSAFLLTSCSNNKTDDIEKETKYKIAYNVHLNDTINDNWEIFCMNIDGTGKKNITNNTDVAWTYYAYKNRLFFISDRDTCYRCYFLYEADSDGNNVKKVSNLQLEDSWMSSRNDGEELVVAGRIGKEIRYQLFIIKTRTGNFRQITSDTSAMFSDPCFSPEGKQIVFSYKKNKRDRSTHEELFLMNDDGTGMMQLTHYPEDNPSAKEYGYRAGASRWHPTENFISYISKQDGRHSIFAVTPDGKKKWKLTNNEFAEGWHDWSPDGNWLVYNSSDIDENQFHITLMNWETKAQKQLTDTTFKSQQAPVFIEK